MQFQLVMSATWESVYEDNDTSNKLNTILYSFLNIYDASFQVKYKRICKGKNDWTTQGIKTSFKCKRSLFMYGRKSNDPNTRAFYTKYCKIVNNAVRQVRQ